MIRKDFDVQKELALSIVRLETEERELADLFSKDKKVIIYGAGIIGRYLCSKLVSKVNVLCIVDKIHNGVSFNGIPVISPTELSDYQKPDKNVLIIITPMSAWDDIVKFINRDYDIHSIYYYIAMAEKDIIMKVLNPQTKRTVENIFKHKTDEQQIFFCGTMHSLLLFFLYKKNIDNVLVVVDGRSMEAVARRLSAFGNLVIYLEDNKYLLMDFLRFLSYEYDKKELRVYGQDHISAAHNFLGYSLCVIEDGNANYSYEEACKFLFKVKRYNDSYSENTIYVPLGYDVEAEKVIMSGMCEIPDEIKDKSYTIDMVKEWKCFDKSKREYIRYILGINNEDIRDIDILFLGEALTDIMTYDEELIIYKNVLKKYRFCNVIIKPHPRGLVDFKSLFPEYKTIRGDWPVEMLFLEKCSIGKIICYKNGTIALLAKKYGYSIVEYDDNGAVCEDIIICKEDNK